MVATSWTKEFMLRTLLNVNKNFITKMKKKLYEIFVKEHKRKLSNQLTK